MVHHQVHRQTQEQLYWNVVTVNNRYGERVWVPASIRPQHRLDFASQLSSITYGSMMVDGHRVHMPRVIMDYKVKKQEIETAHQVSLNCTGFWSYISFLFRYSRTTCSTPAPAQRWTGLESRQVPT